MSHAHNRSAILAALALTVPLVLSGCGSDDDSADTTKTATTTASAEKSTTAEKSTDPEKSDEKKADKDTAAKDKDGADKAGAQQDGTAAGQAAGAGAAPQLQDPFGGPVPAPNLEPVDGGAASPEDAGAIQALVEGFYGEQGGSTLHQKLGYMVDNTCQAVIEENGGRQALEQAGVGDVPVDQVPGFDPNASASVSDMRVDGDTASATVTATQNGQQDSSVMRFQRENGRWTFCDR